MLALALFLSTAGAATLHADDWRPWQKVKATEISWRSRWNDAWSDYDIEIRNGYDYGVRLRFAVRCGKDKDVAFWSLQPGTVASFLEKFPSGGPQARLTLEIVELERQE